MAIKYLDLYDGNDANDGLTASTPKKTLNAATALVGSVVDEVRVRGKDDLFVDIGNWTWTNESIYVVFTGADKTADVPAGTYICKTIISSGNTIPHIYRVSSVAYEGGDTTITLFIDSNNYYYIGDTETVATSKLSIPAAMPQQTYNKNGYYTGTLTDYTGRTFNTITGGWDSGYTTQNGFTAIYGTSNYILSHNNKSYWNMSRIIYITTSNNGINDYRYNTYTDSFLGSFYHNNGGSIYINDADYKYSNNIVFFGQTNGRDLSKFVNCFWIYGANLLTSGSGNILENCTGATTAINYLSTANNFINCKFISLNKNLVGNYTSNFTGCTFQDIGATANINIPINGNVVNCTFDMNRNRTTGYISGDIYPITTYSFTNNSGATGQYMRHNISGILKTTRFKLWQGANTIKNLIWYNINNEDLGLSDFTANSLYDYETNNVIYNYTTGITKNALLSKYGYTILSDDYYTGKTGTTGATNSVLHVVTTNNAACDFSNVDFVINKSNSYNLSFYAKGSGSYTLNWNILNGGEYVFSSWQTQAITAGAWQQITKAISASDWKMSGTATLVIRIPSQAKGTYALIDYIQLT